MPFDLSKIIRPKILNLEPYRCARDDFKEGVLLDANENAHGPTIKDVGAESKLHRYPDPHQLELKNLMANYRNKHSSFKDQNLPPLTAENICLGVGSDESIDALIRVCCVPSKDKIMIMPPTYGMYSICADINDVGCVKVPLVAEDNSFQMDTSKVLETLAQDPTIKLIFITSPGNPTAALIDTAEIEKVLNNWTGGLVVVDEAYIDFCGGSTTPLVNKYPNLAVIQTMSKSFGLAGVRLGLAFTSTQISRVLNSMKAPYNISAMTSEVCLRALQPDNLENMEYTAELINEQKSRVLKELTSLEYVENEHIGGLDANFILIRLKDGNNELAKSLYYNLATESGVVTRFRGNEPGCSGGIRIAIGTPEENDILIREFKRQLDKLTK